MKTSRAVRGTAILLGLAALALLTTSCGGKRAGGTWRTTTGSAGASTQQQADNQNALDNDAATLATDSFNLRGELATLEGDAPAGAEALARERTAVQVVLRDLQRTNSATGKQICRDAATTQGDADNVHRDAAAQQGDGDTFVGDEPAVSIAITQLQADSDHFRQNLTVIRNYVPAGAPSAAVVAAAIASARAAVTHGRSKLAADLHLAKRLLVRVDADAARARARCTQGGK